MDGIGFTAVSPIPEVDSLDAAIAILPKDTRWALQHIKAPDGGQSIANDIKHGRAIAVSDGSLKASIGTAAFILTGQSIAQAVIGAHVVPGITRVLKRLYEHSSSYSTGEHAKNVVHVDM
jgi:hypothetical protein